MTAAHGDAARIRQLAREKNALLLAHVYQRPEIQDLADEVGDSLHLSRVAARAGAPLVVFCGVRFMAETAKILSPLSRVVMPDPGAGCPMADMITAEDLRGFRAKHPGVPVVCYVNSSAEVKALSDLCVTSGNAVEAVAALPDPEFVFVPDRWLGGFIAERTGKKAHLWPGFCPIHQRFCAEELLGLKALHPEAETIVHPECDAEIRDLADHVLGTGGMAKRVVASPANLFIIGTEVNFLHRLARIAPGKRYLALSPQASCANMAKSTLGNLLDCLEREGPEITVPEATARDARACLDRMVKAGPAAP